MCVLQSVRYLAEITCYILCKVHNDEVNILTRYHQNKKQNKKINYVKAEKREQNLHHEASRGVWDFHS